MEKTIKYSFSHRFQSRKRETCNGEREDEQIARMEASEAGEGDRLRCRRRRPLASRGGGGESEGKEGKIRKESSSYIYLGI